MNSTFYKTFLQNKKQLTLLDGKRPIKKNWVNKKIDDISIESHTDNIGWVMGIRDLVIDVDKQNGGLESYEKLCEDILIDLTSYISVLTPSGGFHIYMEIPEQYKSSSFSKRLQEYPGIDFLTRGSQCVIPGSETKKGFYKWADSDFDVFNQELCPESLIDKLIQEPGTSKSKNEKVTLSFDQQVEKEVFKWPEDKVWDTINMLDPSMEHDEWIKVGMALKQWDDEKGFEIFDEWSKGGLTYDENVTKYKWSKISANGGITIGTLDYMSNKEVFTRQQDRISEYMTKISNSDEFELRNVICKKIQKEKMEAYDREKLAKMIKDRLEIVTSVRVSISAARGMVASRNEENQLTESESPDWCKGWWYITGLSMYMHMDSLVKHSGESFNVQNGRYVPPGPTGTKVSASKYTSDNGFVPCIEEAMYLPQYEGRIVEIQGRKIYNTFNPQTVPIADEELNEKGIEMGKRLEKHVLMICSNNKEYASLLMQFLCHNVQFPGKKIRWMPVIESIQGTGKTYFHELMMAVSGNVNVGKVNPAEVTSQFNSWAVGSAFTIFEELKVSGQNRYACANALKTLITDKMFQVNEKGVKQYMTYNTSNFIAFTNYKDCIPIDKDDRRFFILNCEWANIDQICKYLGVENIDQYFADLFDDTWEHAGQLRRFMLDYEISDYFKSLNRAPDTKYKLAMISTEERSFEGLQECKELIDIGSEYYNNSIICTSDLFDDLSLEFPELMLNNQEKNRLLKKLGYSSHHKSVKIDGKSRRVWTSTPMTNREILLKLKYGDDILEDI